MAEPRTHEESDLYSDLAGRLSGYTPGERLLRVELLNAQTAQLTEANAQAIANLTTATGDKIDQVAERLGAKIELLADQVHGRPSWAAATIMAGMASTIGILATALAMRI